MSNWTTSPHLFVPGQPHRPTLLLLHGTGGSEHDLVPLAQEMLPGAALLAPRGAVQENGMPRFFRRLAEGVFDLPDLHRRTKDLAEFVAGAAREYAFDPARVVALGYSNGANIAASLLLSHRETLCGAALLRAMTPFEPETSGSLQGKPVLLAAGRRDSMVPIPNVERLAELLQERGAKVELAWADLGHQLGELDFVKLREWFRANFE